MGKKVGSRTKLTLAVVEEALSRSVVKGQHRDGQRDSQRGAHEPGTRSGIIMNQRALERGAPGAEKTMSRMVSSQRALGHRSPVAEKKVSWTI